MVKEKRVDGTYVRVTNYDETGPGYLSAYGLVAAIHEEMRKGPDGARFFDNGIRTHGSFDYPSLRGRFSHGCHRLYNQLAMRLFSFVLEHRRVARRSGRSPLGFRRTFWSQGEVFEMRLPSRGFYRELEPPIPVDVLEGRIKGTLTKPIAGYVPKPGVTYASRRLPAASDTPDDKAGRGRAMTAGDDAARRGGAGARPGGGAIGCSSRGAARAGPGAAAPRRAGAAAAAPARRARAPPLPDDLEPAAPDDRADAGTGHDQAASPMRAARRTCSGGARISASRRWRSSRPRGSAPLDLTILAPDCLPLHTRVFTDRDDTLSLRLYTEREAPGCPGIPRRDSPLRPTRPHYRDQNAAPVLKQPSNAR